MAGGCDTTRDVSIPTAGRSLLKLMLGFAARETVYGTVVEQECSVSFKALRRSVIRRLSRIPSVSARVAQWFKIRGG